MSIEITMPKLSDTMEEGKILRWLKHPGDKVSHGDALAEVETDKADMTLEAFDDGVLQELRLKEGESAAVGAVIALLGAPGEVPQPRAATGPQPAALQAEAPADNLTPAPPRAVSESAGGKRARKPSARAAEGNGRNQTQAADEGVQEREAPPLQANETQPELAVGSPRLDLIMPQPEPPQGGHAPLPARQSEEPAGAEGKLKASPLARRAAEEAGLDLNEIKGSGPEGRVTKQDVDNFLREQQLFRQRRLVHPREGLPGTREELSRMRKTIAQRMAASKREIPHFYVTVEVDMEEAVRFKKSLEVTELFDEAVTYNDIVVKACALALGRYPRINASFDGDAIIVHPSINIGMAVAVEDGLIVPVIKDCQRLTLPQIARAAHRLVTKAAQGGFNAEDLSGGTFTISNMGMLGIEHFAAVINPPQAAIVAVSSIKERPVVRNGQLAVGTTMMLTISCDHRIVDGVVAGRFLQEVKRFLENPASLLV